jgi:L-cysteine/cystine lyase
MAQLHTQLAPHRQKYPALQSSTYFNYGGQGPLAQPSLDAILTAYQDIQRLGPFSTATYRYVTDLSDRLRHTIARTIGTPPDTITLTENVTVGCNIPLWGIDWQPNDHLILGTSEHPGIVATVQELQRRFGIQVTRCHWDKLDAQGNPDPLADLAAQLRPTTRLVVLSHILWNNGQVLPLADIGSLCRGELSHPADRRDRATLDPTTCLTLVDAAQSIGLLPLDLQTLNIDFYAFTGHKWWCGPEGVGGLYINPAVLDRIRPTFIGWRSIDQDPQGNPAAWKPDGRRYEVATAAYPLYAGLIQAIELHQTIGSDTDRYHQICHLAQQLWEGLGQIPGITRLTDRPPQSGLVALQFDRGSPEACVAHLEAQSIYTRVILAPKSLRACVHYLSQPTEIDRLLEAIAAWTNAQPH